MPSTKTNSEIKRIPHPSKVPKDQDKIVLNYRFEEVIGYGNQIRIQDSRSLIYIYLFTQPQSLTYRRLGKSEKGMGCK